MFNDQKIDLAIIERKLAALPVLPLLAKELSTLIPADPDILERKLAELPVIPILAKELSTLIPTIVKEQTSQFAAAWAHEVRNPLSNINLAAEMLQSTGLNEEQGKYIDIILRGTGRINGLVTDFLNSYQPDATISEMYNIHQLLDEVLEITKDRITLKNIAVMKYYTSVDCKVLVNGQKVKIALSNIIINAIEAMGPEKGELKLLTKSINDKCVLEISDNGIGISKQNLDNIFKPYFTNKHGGMGLGLSTTLNTLQLNHASLVVKSEESKGTSFIISFEKQSDTYHRNG